MPFIPCPHCARLVQLPADVSAVTFTCPGCGGRAQALPPVPQARERRRPWLAVALPFVVALAVLLTLLAVLSQRRDADATATGPAPTVSRKSPPKQTARVNTKPKGPRVFGAEEFARGHEALRGKSVLVADTVMWLGDTGLNERLFWHVPEGRGFVGLGQEGADRPKGLCVFRGG
jgi:hypothetical protein